MDYSEQSTNPKLASYGKWASQPYGETISDLMSIMYLLRTPYSGETDKGKKKKNLSSEDARNNSTTRRKKINSNQKLKIEKQAGPNYNLDIFDITSHSLFFKFSVLPWLVQR